MRADVNEPLTVRLRRKPILADGAMGTLLFSRGATSGACVELANIESPGEVLRAHREYVAAGAELLTANTFAANRLRLAQHDLAGRCAELNAAGVRLARQAADGRAYVAASIGPTGALLRPLGTLDFAEAADVFGEQASALAAELPDLLLLETFVAADEALLALAAAKRVAPTIPACVSLSVTDDGTTPAGDDLEKSFRRLIGAGADIVGVNCAVGPQAAYTALARVRPAISVPFSVMPNAGFPENIDGRMVYRAGPAYFAMFARDFLALGASIIGGCCGTTPEVIAAMRGAMTGAAAPEISPVSVASPSRAASSVAHARETTAPRSETNFERKLGREFVVTVEIAPPRGVDCAASLEAAALLERAGADAVNIADNPTGRLRMSSIALAHLVHGRTNLATILHLTCRDRNLLALQSELLGAAALDVTAIVALTGDPSNVGDFPRATSVFDVTATGLTGIVRSLNAGRDLAGNDLGAPTRFRIGAAVDPLAHDLTAELVRFEEKVAAGADFALTPPVFDPAALQPFLERTTEGAIPLIVGVLPLRSYRNAEYLHNEVPGMHIPDRVREGLRRAADAESEGVAQALEVLARLRATPGVAGAYILPQGRYEAAAALIGAALAKT